MKLRDILKSSKLNLSNDQKAKLIRAYARIAAKDNNPQRFSDTEPQVPPSDPNQFGGPRPIG